VPFPTALFYLICHFAAAFLPKTVSQLTHSPARLWTVVIILLALSPEGTVHRYLKMIVFGVSLIVPVAISAQDRDQRDGRQNNEQNRRYEDKAHKDFHEWNSGEDQAYRRYLQEHHKKYHEFTKANKKEQNDYWNWRHSHPENDRH
jgi:hypothetical protein